MANRKKITFDAFTLDAANELLWKGTERIFLRPKTFAFLKYLIERPGQLATKQELLSALWGDLNIGDEALKHCVGEIRKVLEDSPQSPRYVETVYRRGYRFVGNTGAKQKVDGNLQPVPKDSNRNFSAGNYRLVGRASELAQLHHSLAKAMGGTRQLVFISGDQGIGKTSLIDTFLNIVSTELSPDRDAESQTQPSIARGQCIKSHGAGEAYLPILEALTSLCSMPDRRRTIAILRRHAPLWLSQMPSLISAAQLRTLQQITSGSTRERMLREMAEALEILTAETSLILVLEDLHWSDYSTLDLISYWAQRRGPARLLLIATFRPLEVLAGDHPLKILREDLEAHQLCQELPLPFLNKTAIEEYLMRRFPGHRFPVEAAEWIKNRTGGNPLFMVNVFDHLETRGLIVRHNKYWELNTTLENAELLVPPTIQQIIERQFERCAPQEQRLLQAGSVEGVEFSVEAAAAVLGEKADRIEAVCRKLAERRQFLNPAGGRRATDGRRISCYSFTHALYQNVCYQLLREDLRAQLHRLLAEYIEGTSSASLSQPAARLAMHFDHAMEYSRALKYYLLAAENANSRYAGREALGLASRGLQLLDFVPEDSERMESEMCLRIALGTAMMSARGIGAEEVSRSFSRARELFQNLDKSHQSKRKTLLFSVLYGLWNYHWVRADYRVARELAEKLMCMAEEEKNPILLSQAHHSLGIIMMDHGEFAGAYEHLRRGTGVVTRCCAALTRWNLGYPDQAMKSIEETLAYALETGNPENGIFANLCTARVHMARREGQKTLDRVQAALDLALDQGLVEQWTAPMKSIRGWALSRLGQVQNGLEQARQALAVFRTIRFSNLMPLLTAIFAEISMDAGRIEEGLAALDEALEVARNTEMRHHDAELYRLKGALLLQQIARHPKSFKNNRQLEEAESSFELAIDVSRQQEGKSLELRATTSLARGMQLQNRHEEAHERLLSIYTWFTEGYDTPDLQDAHAVLAELS